MRKIEKEKKGKRKGKKESKREKRKKEKGKMELIIAEKPKAAQRIAFALAKDFKNIKKKNYFGVPFYEIADIVVASAVGHLFILGEKEKLDSQSWQDVRGWLDWPIFDIEWKPIYEVSKQTYAKKYIEALKRFKPDKITIACDYDTEGELIGYNILRFIFNIKPSDAFRMKFSTLTKHDLVNAYEEKMNGINFNQAIAGESRHILDWIYGINLSRALMSCLKERKILSIGRVQGPALAILVKREEEIKNFKPEVFWNVFLKILQTVKGKKISALLELKERIKKKDDLKKFEKFRGESIIVNVEKTDKSITPFPPFNLTDLQTEAYRLYGLDPSETLAIAQELYLDGFISYPRTSSQKLPPAIGYNIILQKLTDLLKNLLKLDIDQIKKRQKPVEGKMTDPAHPAIFPTGEGDIQKLDKEKRKVYDLIVKRFLACFMDDAIIETKKISAGLKSAELKDLKFVKSLKRVKHEGWLAIYPYEIEEEWNDVEDGEARIDEIIFKEGQTQPPPRFNPASLVRELEKRKLGTKATRAQIIETLYKRKYIIGKSIRATPLGVAVKNVLEKISSLVLDETLTRKFELELDKILLSVKPLEEQKKILEEAKKVIEKIAKDYEKNKEKLQQIISDGMAKAEEFSMMEKTIGKCNCGENLILKRSKKNYFIGCRNWPKCNVTYSLPKGKICKGKSNCICGWQRLRLWRTKKASFEFCANPSCWEFWLKKIEKKKKSEKSEKNRSEK